MIIAVMQIKASIMREDSDDANTLKQGSKWCYNYWIGQLFAFNKIILLRAPNKPF